MILLAFFCYLLGSVPFGLILTRLAGLGDVRAIGSGNIGATNVLRTGNKGLAALTLVFDMAKAMVPIMLLADHPEDQAWLGLCVVLGHCFPVFLKFRGGKGVATALGVYAGISLILGGCFAVVWLGMAFVFRYSSLAALAAVVVMPVVFGMLMGWGGIVPLVAMSALVVWRHRDNIRRLRQGQESRIAFTKAPTS
jgi:glycerol-3-phosphate acyltransferase PlsY